MKKVFLFATLFLFSCTQRYPEKMATVNTLSGQWERIQNAKTKEEEHIAVKSFINFVHHNDYGIINPGYMDQKGVLHPLTDFSDDAHQEELKTIVIEVLALKSENAGIKFGNWKPKELRNVKLFTQE